MSGLVEVLSQQTVVPAPESLLVRSANSHTAYEVHTQASAQRKVKVSVSSEFMPHTIPVDAVSSEDRIELLQDSTGQPIVFALSGNQQRLVLLIHVSGAPIAFQKFDISPSGASSHINTFDLYQSVDTHIHIAASVVAADGTCDIYYTTIALPTITWDDIKKQVEGFSDKDVSWTLMHNNLGRKVITSLSVGPAAANDESTGYHVVAGSQATAKLIATNYSIDVMTGTKSPWAVLPLPATAKRVNDLCAGSLNDGPGVYTLFTRNDNSTGCAFDLLSGGIFYTIQSDHVGTAQAIYANANPWGQTDLFVAGTSGIGFFNFQYIDESPTKILQKISFKQVVSSEAVDPGNPTTQSILTVFALSEHDELYYIQGIRLFQGDDDRNVVRFSGSGYPIRANVERISAQYNSKSNASELIYLGNGSNEIWHLWKDPSTSLWHEDQVSVPTTGQIQTYAAYHTTITFKDDQDLSLGGYPFSITSNVARVLVNNRTHVLDASPTAFEADASGQCHIIIRTDENLSCPRYKILLTEFAPNDQPVIVDVEPAQRVIKILGTVKTADDIKKASSTAGKPVFQDSRATDGDFQLATSVLTNLPIMANHIDPLVTKTILGNVPVGVDQTISWQKDANGRVTRTDDNWISKAVDAVEHFLGDVLEAYRTALVAVTKIAMKVVGPVISLVFEIAGKAIRFIITHIGPMLRSFTNFLKDTLGIDINKFLDWLGFVLDFDKILKTQKILIKSFTNMIETSKRLVKVNQPVVARVFDSLHETGSRFIKDSRISASGSVAESLGIKSGPSPLEFILNNPVINAFRRYSPLSIIEEAVGDEIQLPDISAIYRIFTDVLPDLIEEELENIIRLIKDVYIKVKAMLDDQLPIGDAILQIFGDAFWTLFDALKDIVLAVFTALADLLEAGSNLMTGSWKIPGISDLWKALTEQDLSFMNLVTFVLATGMNLFTLSVYGKLPFDGLGDFAALFDVSEEHLDLGKLFSQGPAWTKNNTPASDHVVVSAPRTSVKVAASLQNHITTLRPRKKGTMPIRNFRTLSINKSADGAPPTQLPPPTAVEDAIHTYSIIDKSLSLAARCSNSGTTIGECLVHWDEIGEIEGAEGFDFSAPNKSIVTKAGQWFTTKSQQQKIVRKIPRVRREDPKKIDKVVGKLTMATDVFQIVFRCAQIGVCFGYQQHFEGTKRSIHAMEGRLSVAFKILSAVFNIAGIATRALQGDDIANMLHAIGSAIDSAVCGCVCEYGLIEDDKSTTTARAGLAGNIIETVGSACSIAGAGCHMAIARTKDVDAIFPMLAFNGLDVVCSFGAVTNTIIALT